MSGITARRRIYNGFAFVLWCFFALWFGGFTFYAGVVVPIGTDELGSALAQGLVTRRVTVWLNGIGMITVLLMAANTFRCRGAARRQQWIMVAILACCLAALTLFHALMDRQIDVEAGSLSDPERFYRYHQIYLWISIVQWVTCGIWLWLQTVDRLGGSATNRPVAPEDA